MKHRGNVNKQDKGERKIQEKTYYIVDFQDFFNHSCHTLLTFWNLFKWQGRKEKDKMTRNQTQKKQDRASSDHFKVSVWKLRTSRWHCPDSTIRHSLFRFLLVSSLLFPFSSSCSEKEEQIRNRIEKKEIETMWSKKERASATVSRRVNGFVGAGVNLLREVGEWKRHTPMTQLAHTSAVCHFISQKSVPINSTVSIFINFFVSD